MICIGWCTAYQAEQNICDKTFPKILWMREWVMIVCEVIWYEEEAYPVF